MQDHVIAIISFESLTTETGDGQSDQASVSVSKETTQQSIRGVGYHSGNAPLREKRGGGIASKLHTVDSHEFCVKMPLMAFVYRGGELYLRSKYLFTCPPPLSPMIAFRFPTNLYSLAAKNESCAR